MATDPKTAATPNCDDCGLLTIPTTDPLIVLSRLPSALFNLKGPTEPTIPAFLAGDVLTDASIFGPIFGDETPQYELARIIAEERDRFVEGWRIAEGLQLGVGHVEVINGRTQTECPHASGGDLDRVGEQYGIGRPQGFTDCCYWRLIVLLLFKPGPTLWRLLEVSALYTGDRPTPIEEPAKLGLLWPEPVDYGSFFNDQAFFDNTAFFNTDDEAVSSDLDSYWLAGNDPALDDIAAFWNPLGAFGGIGLTLRQSLTLAKPAGVALQLFFAPPAGRGGCQGATGRGPTAERGHWA